MKSFLEHVAQHIYDNYGENLTDVAVVFPNKRASLFLNKYLHRLIGHAFWSPHYITISELFRQQSKLKVADPIKTNCMLHSVYNRLCNKSETIDEFWNWGEMILADYDDIDKNMGDAGLIFTNIRDLKALDSISYLTTDQRATLHKFFADFSEDYDSELKKRFIQLWNNLLPVYQTLNEEMRNEGLCYEGALYREVAEQAESLEWPYKHYLFVGFNMIQESEQRLFKSMKDKGLAHFYWDFDMSYFDDSELEAGTFISKYVTQFPNEFDIKDEALYDNFRHPKDIDYLASSTEDIQARYISDWLHQNGRIEAAERTAIVLADETLLKSVIHHLPDEISGKANITIGYPLAQSPVTSLVKSFVAIHTGGYQKSYRTYTQKTVLSLLRHPYMYLLTSKADGLIAHLRDDHVYFPGTDELCLDEGLSLIFSPVEGKGDFCLMLCQRLLDILKTIGRNAEGNRQEELAYMGLQGEDVPLTYEEQLLQESVFRMHAVMTRLSDLIAENTLSVQAHTLLRLIDKITQSTTMPFHGEPAIGIQVMGMLETRNLDFDHVLILSTGEGNLPKGINDSSLIPYFIRKAHKLTTIDNKVAIYAYYFYRLLQRCQDATFCYNSSTEDGHTGQMSRFMLQLMVENRHINLRRGNLTAKQMPSRQEITDVNKTDNVLTVLDGMKSLSPSALATYLRCPLMFYYQNVAYIKEPDTDDVSDVRIFGTIFHAAAEKIYTSIKTQEGVITREMLDYLLNQKGHASIYKFVDEAFRDEIFYKSELRYDGLQSINREVIGRFLVKLLEADRKLTPFCIRGLEAKAYTWVKCQTAMGERGLSIGGIIDRLDEVTIDGHKVLRVVDYKTGTSMPVPFADIPAIFDKANIDKHSNYYLQTMLYSIIVRHDYKDHTFEGKTTPALNPMQLPVRPALLYIQKSESLKDPVLKMKDKDAGIQPIYDIQDYEQSFHEELDRLIKEIFDPSIPFRKTEYPESRCKFCRYANLCKV